MDFPFEQTRVHFNTNIHDERRWVMIDWVSNTFRRYMAVQGKNTLLLWKNNVPSYKLFDSIQVRD